MTLTLELDATTSSPDAALLRALGLVRDALAAPGASLRALTDDGPVLLVVGVPPGDDALVLPVPAGAEHDGGAVRLAAVADDSRLREAGVLTDLVSLLLDSELARRRADRAVRQAVDEARRDPLTGLGNRRAWQQALQAASSRARRSGSALAVLVVDLDALKHVNDSTGHAAGDALLRRTAEVLQEEARAGDTVCRLGGDEFGLVAVLHDGEDARQLRDRLDRALAAAGVAASVGVATGTGRLDAAHVADLVHEADVGMYRAKRASSEARRARAV